MSEPGISQYKQASNLILISLLISITGVVVRLRRYDHINFLYIVLLIWIFTAGIAFLIRKEIKWSRYLLLILALANLSMASYIIDLLSTNVMKAILIIIPALLQLWATFLVFSQSSSKQS